MNVILIVGLIIFAITAYAIIKRYQTTAILMLSGIALFGSVFLISYFSLPRVDGALPADYIDQIQKMVLPDGLKSFKTTGSLILDIMAIFVFLMKTRIGEIGLIIMAAGGFAKYMDHIGAADTFVAVGVKPLHIIKSPYTLLAIAYFIGQTMNIVIPSAAGLGMLLLVTLYPILRKLGVTAAAAAAVLASTACLDLGPASGNSNAAAKLSSLTPMEYFISYQALTSFITMIVISALFFITAKYFDRQDAKNHVEAASTSFYSIKDSGKELKAAPKIYAILPLLPIILLIVFSKYVIESVKLDVIAAMFISLIVGITFEIIRKKGIKQPLKDITSFFAGMADMLKSVVILLVAAEFFATGLQAAGLTKALLSLSHGAGFGVTAMTAVLVGIIAVFAFVSGSGNSAFFSFANLAPEVASKMGVPIVQMVLPMQLAAGIFRSVSPVAGVVIAIAGATGVTPISVVKRTAIPMIGGGIAMFICSQILL